MKILEDPNVKFIIDSKAQEIKEHYKLHGTEKTIAWIHDTISLYYENEKAKKEMTCSKGCSFCCHDLIIIHPDEYNYIYKLAKKHKIKTNKKVSKLFNSTKKEQLKWHHKRCPFLTDNDVCSIYEFRPMICRTHNSSDKKELCFNPDKNIPHKQIYINEADAYMLGLFVLTKAYDLEPTILNKMIT